MKILKCKGEKLLKRELRGDFKFFIKEANTNKKSKDKKQKGKQKRKK